MAGRKGYTEDQLRAIAAYAYEQGNKATAKRYSCGMSTITRAKKAYAPEELSRKTARARRLRAEILRLHDEGLPVKEIAAKASCTKPHVYRVLAEAKKPKKQAGLHPAMLALSI